ncbi:MAG: 3-deoxy-D-manno-octulosonic acid transferase [Flavobacteriales bacterium]|nr:3-deoxy-D-manno-octulosonic acid transferase [Flavobacteriales bacterium]
MVQQALYDLMMRMYVLGIRLAYPFKEKARLWLQGRKNWAERLQQVMQDRGGPVIWIHAASLGEFEQGRPIIEALRKEFPHAQLVLSFFSPSGYTIRKDYDKVDLVTYLPLDTKQNAKRFIEILDPTIALFIKYEFWFNHLNELKRNQIPTILVSGRLHAKQGFFKPWGGFFKKGLEAFSHFFLQNEESARLLEEIGFTNYTVNGDTRFDRVMEMKNEERSLEKIERFCRDLPVIVVGSSWPYDEILMMEYINSHPERDFKVIFAPHEIDQKRISEFINKCRSPAIRYSEMEESSGNEKVLFVDSIGMLSYLYKYATVALIGGGFGAGIHNTLEAAVWSRPILFGPRYQMFKEAVDLVENGAAFSVETQKELNAMLNKLLFEDEELKESAGQQAWRYCAANQGASQEVISYVRETLPS